MNIIVKPQIYTNHVLIKAVKVSMAQCSCCFCSQDRLMTAKQISMGTFAEYNAL